MILPIRLLTALCLATAASWTGWHSFGAQAAAAEGATSETCMATLDCPAGDCLGAGCAAGSCEVELRCEDGRRLVVEGSLSCDEPCEGACEEGCKLRATCENGQSCELRVQCEQGQCVIECLDDSACSMVEGRSASVQSVASESCCATGCGESEATAVDDCARD